ARAVLSVDWAAVAAWRARAWPPRVDGGRGARGRPRQGLRAWARSFADGGRACVARPLLGGVAEAIRISRVAQWRSPPSAAEHAQRFIRWPDRGRDTRAARWHRRLDG